MKICPVALAIGCRKCPIFRPCPAKGIIGDYREDEVAPPTRAAGKPAPSAPAQASGKTKPAAAARRRRSGKSRGKPAK